MNWEEKRPRNARIVQLHRQGMTIKALADTFGLTPGRVRVICKSGGTVARRSRGDLMATLRDQGMTYQAIADKFGCSRQAVHDAVNRRTVKNAKDASRAQGAEIPEGGMTVELDIYKDKTMIILKTPDGQIVDRIETDGIYVRDFHQYLSSYADPRGTLPVPPGMG